MSLRKSFALAVKAAGFTDDNMDQLTTIKGRKEGGWWLLMESNDFEYEDVYYITYFNGSEFAGVPMFDTDDLDEALQYFEELE
jgi:hypothetical protein